MRAPLGLERAVGVVAPHRDRGRADPRLLGLEVLVDLDLESLALEVPEVHAQEDLGPVRSVDTPGSGVDRQDRSAVVVVTEEEALVLEITELCVERDQLGRDILCRLGVALLVGHLEKGLRVVEGFREAVDLIDDLVETGERARHLAGVVGIVPERGIGSLLPQTGQLTALAVDVKGTSWRRRGETAGRRSGLGDRYPSRRKRSAGSGAPRRPLRGTSCTSCRSRRGTGRCGPPCRRHRPGA